MSKQHFIYGLHAVAAVLQQTPENITKLSVQQGRHDQRVQQIIKQAKKSNIAVEDLPRRQLDQLANTENHQGILAVCLTKTYQENDLESLLDQLSTPPFLLILDGVQDPHNLGACLRSANAAGVNAVIIPKDKAVGLTPVVRKVASGAAEVTPLISVTNLARTLEKLKQRGIWLYGAAGEAEKTIHETDLTGPIALILGAEGKGLRRLTRESCDGLLNIPMCGTVASLNVSVATGICLFEALRQRCVPSIA